MEKRISGHTGLLALIGSPVGHSGSPAMYNYSFEKLGLDYAYVAFDIKEDKVKDAIAAMKTFNMRGCNVTMPDKVEAAKYMDELSLAAQIIGAINTIVNDNGKLTGHITDGEGFVHNLKDHGIDIKGKKITVAGGGGAATAIQVQWHLLALEILLRTTHRIFPSTDWISQRRRSACITRKSRRLRLTIQQRQILLRIPQQILHQATALQRALLPKRQPLRWRRIWYCMSAMQMRTAVLIT